MYFTAIYFYHRQSHLDTILIELVCEIPRDPFSLQDVKSSCEMRQAKRQVSAYVGFGAVESSTLGFVGRLGGFSLSLSGVRLCCCSCLV